MSDPITVEYGEEEYNNDFETPEEEELETDEEEEEQEEESYNPEDDEDYDDYLDDEDLNHDQNDENDEDEDENDEDEDEEDNEEDEAASAIKEELKALTAQGDAAAVLLAKSNISYNALKEEYRTNGELSEKTLAQLEKAGYTRELVENFIEGQQARYEASYGVYIRNAVGGDKEYARLIKWAGNNLSSQEINRFNKAVTSNDIDIALVAVENLANRMEKAKGTPPELIEGKPTAEHHTKGYASLAEMATAMDDPRYEKDMAYTERVERRIIASDF